MTRDIAFADEIGSSVQPPEPVREIENRLTVGRRKPAEMLQLLKPLRKRMFEGVHVLQDRLGREHGSSLSRHGPCG